LKVHGPCKPYVWHQAFRCCAGDDGSEPEAAGEGDLERGSTNLEKHIGIVRGFGLPVVVAVNRFPHDTLADLDSLRTFCEVRGAEFAPSEAYAKGGEGAMALAQKVVEVIDANPNVELTTTYELGDPVIEKITKVAQKVHGADSILR
jgi:formate--tetrahydrofolate ligase